MPEHPPGADPLLLDVMVAESFKRLKTAAVALNAVSDRVREDPCNVGYRTATHLGDS